MLDQKEKQSLNLKVSLRDRAIMLILALIGAVLILKPLVAFQNFSRGNFFMDNGFTKKAISQYQRAILLNPNFSEAYGWLGFAYKQDKQIDKAIEIYKKALKINPKDKQVYFELGLIYFNRENFEEAVFNFKKAAELDPCDLNVQNIEAVAYREMGQTEKAISIWQNILKKNPQYGPARRNLEKLK